MRRVLAFYKPLSGEINSTKYKAPLFMSVYISLKFDSGHFHENLFEELRIWLKRTKSTGHLTGGDRRTVYCWRLRKFAIIALLCNTVLLRS